MASDACAVPPLAAEVEIRESLGSRTGQRHDAANDESFGQFGRRMFACATACMDLGGSDLGEEVMRRTERRTSCTPGLCGHLQPTRRVFKGVDLLLVNTGR